MIVVESKGGLGNQMFQYAAGRRLALKNKCKLVVDNSWFGRHNRGETKRRFDLQHYPTDMRLAKRTELISWRPMRSRWSRYLRPVHTLKVLRDAGYNVNSEVLDASDNSYLKGFWQSEKYFYDIRPILLKELNPIIPPGPKDISIIERMENCQSVSLHVRRGDYVTMKEASKYHGTCSIEYYKRAAQYMCERIDSPVLFVFSDDPEWTREHLHFSNETHYICHNAPDLAYQDLRMMTHCKNHILANSSFSWWGAWLSHHTNGLVIAPKIWYASGRPTPDLIPDRWIRL